MNRKRIDHLDWSYIRSFVAVAETGSLTAAAKKTGQSQPTVGRHVKAAEAALGVELFTRGVSGLVLTEIGQLLLEPAREMAAASARLQTLAVGGDTRLSGTIRITASVVVSHYILPPIIAKFRELEPDIEIELVPSDLSENLIFRDADIAVRMYRPTQLDIVTKHICDQPIALYAAHSLLQQYGQPTDWQQVSSLPFVGYDQSELIIQAMGALGLRVDRHFFAVRCDAQATNWELVCAGCGVGAMQTVIADADARVTKLAFQPPLPSLPIWLAAPQALRANARIQRVWDHLLEELVGSSSLSGDTGIH